MTLTVYDSRPAGEAPGSPAIPETMLAAVHERYGGPEALESRRVPVPRPEPGQVLVRVRAASLNQVDHYTLRGWPMLARLMGGLRRPRDPFLGHDFSGEVAALGPGVTNVAVGDAVFGTGIRAFAEYVVVKAEGVVARPPSADWVHAAATGVAALTALQAVRTHGALEAGQRVLVTGAGGGVGGFAVRIAKALGAEVTATTRAWNLARVGSMGADRVFESAGRGPGTDALAERDRYDLVVDVAGDRSLGALLRATRPGGRVVWVGAYEVSTIGLVAGMLRRRLASRTSGRRVVSVYAKRVPADLATLRDLLASGAIDPDIERVYAFADLPDAMRHLETFRTQGKIVVAM
jgi:NADPH:quinone reductase-like Zn-dependent oxidoreductase